MQCTIYMTAHYPGFIQELQQKVLNLCLSGMRRSCSGLYIYDSSLSWLDTRTSVESSKPMPQWNEAVMQCTIYMTTHYPGLIQELQQRVPSLCLSGMRRSCSALYIYMTAHHHGFIPELQQRVPSLCLSGMRRSYSALYIYESSLSWLNTRTSVESSKPMSQWNEAVMQCTIYMTAHYPGLIQ